MTNRDLGEVFIDRYFPMLLVIIAIVAIVGAAIYGWNVQEKQGAENKKCNVICVGKSFSGGDEHLGICRCYTMVHP